MSQASETSRAAYSIAKPKLTRRQLAAANHLLLAGSAGLTREQLADALEITIQSICAVAKGLIDSGQAIKSGQRRKTRSGSAAEVLVHRQYGGRE